MAMTNLAIFGVLYIVISSALGLFLAILPDQQIRNEGFIRAVNLYPMAIPFFRYRRRLEMVPRPAHQAGKHHAPLGMGKLRVPIDQGTRPGDLHHCHRGDLARGETEMRLPSQDIRPAPRA
jgi:hypothetical protein